jgi:hypothetical protein
MLTPEQHRALRELQPLMWAEPADRRTIEHDYALSIEPSSFYLGLPSVDEILGSFEYDGGGEALPVHGRELFDLAKECELLRGMQELAPPQLANLCSDTGFDWNNDQFSHSDALNLYLFLKWFQVRKVIEVGCGWSSRISSSVMRAQGGELICVDPSPRADMQNLQAVFHQKRIQDVDPNFIVGGLEAGDLLFIDSSHTLKPGSDCLYLYTRVVPYLQKGVLIHIHDLYLPYPRPMQQVLLERRFWYEDYAVLLLMLGGVITPVLSNYFLCKQPEAAELMLQSPCAGSKGGASIFFVKN